VVTGSITPNGAFTSYWYEYGISAEFGSKTSSQTLGSGYVAIAAPAYITGLTKDTKYYFRLVGENQYGRVNGATATFQTTVGTPAPTGSAPTTKTLAAMSVSRTTANLNGEVTPNKAETQYWFEFGKTTDLGNTSAFQSAGSGSAKVPVAISISNLEGATTYYFRLNAQNQFGTVNGAIMNFKTPGPPAPTKPTVETRNATDVSTSTVLLHGRVNPNGAETQYWFEYSTDSLLGSLLLHTTERTSVGAGSTSTSVEADVEDLTPKTNYYFRMVAENNLGLVYGERMSFKTK
jgi:phosphodiesterase/alkaline phosphatase D-like protein